MGLSLPTVMFFTWFLPAVAHALFAAAESSHFEALKKNVLRTKHCTLYAEWSFVSCVSTALECEHVTRV